MRIESHFFYFRTEHGALFIIWVFWRFRSKLTGTPISPCLPGPLASDNNRDRGVLSAKVGLPVASPQYSVHLVELS